MRLIRLYLTRFTRFIQLERLTQLIRRIHSAGAVICLAPRAAYMSHLHLVLRLSRASHVLTTPALWDLLGHDVLPCHVPHLEVLGGELA